MLCGPGDVYLQNRLTLHGSFANTSPLPRATLEFGFHRRQSVLGKPTLESYTLRNEVRPERVFDEAYIKERSRMIPIAIHARRRKYPDEEPYDYLPFRGEEEAHRWSEALKEDPKFREYWRMDMPI